MIRSFKHKGLELFFGKESTAGINPAHKSKLKMRLVALDTASSIEDMNLPDFRLHSLKGKKKVFGQLMSIKTGALLLSLKMVMRIL